MAHEHGKSQVPSGRTLDLPVRKPAADPLGQLALRALQGAETAELASLVVRHLGSGSGITKCVVVELAGAGSFPQVQGSAGLSPDLLTRTAAAVASAASLLDHPAAALDPWTIGAPLQPVLGSRTAAAVVTAHGRPWGLVAGSPIHAELRAENGPSPICRMRHAAELLGAAVERSHAEQALRENEARFRLLVEGVHGLAVFLLDPAGRVTSWNAGAQSLFGWRAEDVIGRPVADLFSPDDVQHGTPERALRVAASEGRTEDEGWRVRSDGSGFWANVLVTALRDAGGRLRGYTLLTRDLTEHKADLERQRLLRDVQDALASRDEFLSIAGHELRTPITSLQLALQSLHRHATQQHDAELQARVERCERQTARLAHLVDGWLDMARLGTGGLSLSLQRFDLRDAVRRVLSHLKEDATWAGCTFELHAESAALGHWDRVRLEQALANVVSNAIKYGAGRPIQIRVETGVEVVTVAVSDRGIGVAHQQQSRIFEPFGRAVSARSYGGIGLGLYMTRRIIEAHGGTIRVVSDEGQGATFVIELPLANSRKHDGEAQPPEAPRG